MIERIGNVFYRITDMDAAVAFYADVLGLTLKFRGNILVLYQPLAR
jgi:catechol 2,3-dioxygenase-like lactoylglutathione lyase family enzyme